MSQLTESCPPGISSGRVPQKAWLGITLWSFALLAGCSDQSSPRPPAPPTAPPMPVATPAGPPVRASDSAPVDQRAAQSGNSQGTPSAPAFDAGGRSGDSEPLGEEGTFLALTDVEQAGSVWALDLPADEANVDRFAFVLSRQGSDSSAFVIEESDPGTSQKTAPANAVSLPEGFTALVEAGFDSSGLPWRVRCEKDGSVMALVPEGVSVQGKNGRAANAAPEHGVALESYYIDLFEVTHEQYGAYRDSARSTKRSIPEPAHKSDNRREPVTGVSWGEARAYAHWCGRELPTEAEWEKAARGTQGFDFPWGNGVPLWHRPRAVGQIDVVGSFAGDVSPFGVYDLAGNAREWCQDNYGEQYYAQLARESGATAHNPTGPRSSSGANQRVVKGGDPQWHVWSRTGGNMNDRQRDLGFRCAWRLRPPAKKR